jgi:hypothetical protein
MRDICIVFYVPKCNEREKLKAYIEKYGGIVSDLHECFTYQIYPLNVSYTLLIN